MDQQPLYGGCKCVKTIYNKLNWGAPDPSVHLGNVDIPVKCSQSCPWISIYCFTSPPDTSCKPTTGPENVKRSAQSSWEFWGNLEVTGFGRNVWT